MSLIYQSLKDHVYEYISNEIKNKKLNPNEKINEQAICNELNVSRTPVREALIQLSADGLLDITPRRGFRVKALSLKDAQDLYAVIATSHRSRRDALTQGGDHPARDENVLRHCLSPSRPSELGQLKIPLPQNTKRDQKKKTSGPLPTPLGRYKPASALNVAAYFRYCSGLTGLLPLRTSKWRCGPVDLPVVPTLAIFCPWDIFVP